MYLPQNSVILITSSVAILATLLYLREYFLRKKSSTEAQKISLETKQKSIQLLNAAQMAETQVLAESDYTTQKLILEFKTKLENLTDASEKSIFASQDQLIKFMADLQKRSAQFEQSSQSATQQRISELFERLEQKLSDFLIQTEQKTTNSLELELKATRNLVEGYKAQQLKLIDENIIAMMEQTLNIVLGKKLSLKDQLDLIYEALEKAKIDKFVV